MANTAPSTNRPLPLIAALVFVCCAVSTPTEAGKFNNVLDIGQQAPAWKDLVGVDDKQHSLRDLDDQQAVVVVFTCNSCPYAVDVEDRLIELHKQYADKAVAVVAINVNNIPEDRLPAMRQRAEDKSMTFPYLFDPTQQIAKDYGARNTPEFFVLDRDRRVVYMGALDDSPNGKDVTQTYVADAIEAAISGGTPPVEETVPIGCLIRYQRQRGGRGR